MSPAAKLPYSGADCLSASVIGDEAHVLRISIGFLDAAPMKLVGRAGIMEIYSVLANPVTKLTTAH